MTVQYVPETVCPGCGVIDPDMELVDFGNGWTEFWGFVSYHTDEHWVTRCCEAEPDPFVAEPNDNEIPESDVQ